MSEEKASYELLGYSKILLNDIEQCSRTFGTELYRTSVFNLYNDVINLKDGVQLKDLLDAFYSGPLTDSMNKEYDIWRKKHRFPQQYQIDMEKDMLITTHCVPLCNYIKDLLMKNGCVKVFYSTGGK